MYYYRFNFGGVNHMTSPGITKNLNSEYFKATFNTFFFSFYLHWRELNH